MPPITKSLLHYLPTVFLLAQHAVSKHAHHHHVRQTNIAVAVPITSTDTIPTTTIQATRVTSQASNEVISDLQEMKKGLDDLPGDLLTYIQSIEQRLETVESLLQSLLSSAAPTTIAALPSAPAIKTSSSRRGPAPFTATEAAPVPPTETPTSTPSASLRSNIYHTSRITSTKTSIETVTWHMPIPVFSTGALTHPYSYAPIDNGTLAKPTAGPSSGTGAKVVTLTVAVLPATSTITIPGLRASAPTTFATSVRTA